MGFVFSTQRSWKQVGINDENASWQNGQLNKKSLELHHEKEISVDAQLDDR